MAFSCFFTFLSSGSELELTINLVELQKEKERLEEEAKKERKREKKEKKKKEKKEKRSGQEHDLSKELKKNLKRKYEELGLVESKDKHDNHQNHHKSKKPRDEQLERSGLSEEHGQPSTVGLANFESPERSQDSSKRRTSGSMPSPSPSLTNSGMPETLSSDMVIAVNKLDLYWYFICHVNHFDIFLKFILNLEMQCK